MTGTGTHPPVDGTTVMSTVGMYEGGGFGGFGGFPVMETFVGIYLLKFGMER